MQILSIVLTQHLHHFSSPLTSHSLDVFLCAVTLPILPFSTHFSPLLHPSLFSHSSCLWKTPHPSCLGSRGTQTPTALGLWLSLLCQVCQVCVCAVTGKRPHVGSALSGRWSQHGTRNGFPCITSSPRCGNTCQWLPLSH